MIVTRSWLNEWIKLDDISTEDLAKTFNNIGLEVDIPNNSIQTVGYMSDYPKLMKAKELLVDIGSYNKMRYKRSGEPIPQGFKQNPTQYIVVFWERV